MMVSLLISVSDIRLHSTAFFLQEKAIVFELVLHLYVEVTDFSYKIKLKN